MAQTVDLQDLAIVLAARNYNPGMLTPDFLNGSGVVPADWELARPPALSQRATQVVFKNGVRIEGQPGTVSFSEQMGNEDPQAFRVPDLARRYAAALPNLEYLGVGINPRRFVTFGEEAESAHQYITETILSRGSWQNFGTAPMQAGINLVYTLERCQLRLGINEARFKLPDQEVPAVLFAGNFNYGVRGESPAERLESLKEAIAHWQEDLNAYRDLIDRQFLAGVEAEAVSIFPSSAL
jgi:hypothetical protein